MESVMDDRELFDISNLEDVINDHGEIANEYSSYFDGVTKTYIAEENKLELCVPDSKKKSVEWDALRAVFKFSTPDDLKSFCELDHRSHFSPKEGDLHDLDRLIDIGTYRREFIICGGYTNERIELTHRVSSLSRTFHKSPTTNSKLEGKETKLFRDLKDYFGDDILHRITGGGHGKPGDPIED